MGQTHSDSLTNVYSLGDESYGDSAFLSNDNKKDSMHLLYQVTVPDAPTVCDFTAASCGLYHSALISAAGDIYTWGFSVDGQLGHGIKGEFTNSGSSEFEEISNRNETTDDKARSKTSKKTRDKRCDYDWLQAPRLVKELSGNRIKQIACGGRHSIALTVEGSVYTWGHGGNGRLGHGTDLSISHPVKVIALEPYRVESISAGGMHSACITGVPQGWIFTWGLGSSGQLGHSSDFSDRYVPCLIPSLFPKVVSSCETSEEPLSTLMSLTFTSTETGASKHLLFRYNYGCGFGSCLCADSDNSELRVLRIACGGLHTAALTNNGVLLTWGANCEGQLGYNDQQFSNSGTPRVVLLDSFDESDHSKISNAAVTALVDECDSGELKEETTTSSVLADITFPLDPIIDVSLGLEQSAVVTKQGHLYVWGLSGLGCIGSKKTDRPTKVDRKLLGNQCALSVFCGSGQFGICVTRTSDVFFWGSESVTALLGRDAAASSFSSQRKTNVIIPQRSAGVPFRIETLSGRGVVSIGAGKSHLVAVVKRDLFVSIAEKALSSTSFRLNSMKSDSQSVSVTKSEASNSFSRAESIHLGPASTASLCKASPLLQSEVYPASGTIATVSPNLRNSSRKGSASLELCSDEDVKISHCLLKLLFPTSHIHPSLFTSLLRLSRPVIRQLEVIKEVTQRLFGEQILPEDMKPRNILLELLDPFNESPPHQLDSDSSAAKSTHNQSSSTSYTLSLTPESSTENAITDLYQLLSLISSELKLHQQFTIELLKALGTSDTLLAAALDECSRLKESEQKSQNEIKQLKFEVEKVQRASENAISETTRRFAEKEMRWRNTVAHLKKLIDSKS